MNCLIVDDNKIAMDHDETAGKARQKDLTVLGDCANAIDAYNFVQEQDIDLDIARH